MKIRQVADLLGISSRTIRFYEEKGLIQPQKNQENHYRKFEEYDIWQIQTILTLRELGFSIVEIKNLLPHIHTQNWKEQLEIQRSVLYTQLVELRHSIECIDEVIQKDLIDTDHPQTWVAQLGKQAKRRREARNRWKDGWNFAIRSDHSNPIHDQVPAKPFYREYLLALQQTVTQLRPSTTELGLEIGFGTGNLTQRLIDAKSQLCCIDQSLKMLSNTRVFFPTIEMHLGNFLAIPYPDQHFDYIVSSFAFHHLDPDQQILGLQEMMRVCRGRICLTDFYYDDWEHMNFIQKQLNSNPYEQEEYPLLPSILTWFEEHHYICKVKKINDFLQILLAVPIR